MDLNCNPPRRKFFPHLLFLLENLSYVKVEKYKVELLPEKMNENDSLLYNLSEAYNAIRIVPIIFMANEWYFFNESNLEEEKQRLLNDLEELKNKIEKALPEDMIIHSYRIIPIAFGLSSLRLYVIMRHEEGGTDRLEEIIRNIDGVSEVEVGAVSLY